MRPRDDTIKPGYPGFFYVGTDYFFLTNYC